MDKRKYIKADEGRDQPFLFVSYSHEDSEEVQAILEELNRNHYRFWYDEGVKSGREWAEEVGWRIAHCAQFLVVLSERAAVSERVLDEIELAKSYHRDFCPIYLEPVAMSFELLLQIGRKYGIEKYRYTGEEFWERVFGALKPELRRAKASPAEGAALTELKSHYTILEQIGKGGNADVYLARSVRSDALVVVKTVMMDDSYSGMLSCHHLRQERAALLRLSGCQRVPALIDWFAEGDTVSLVEQFIPGVTLAEEKRKYSSAEIVQLGLELLELLSAFPDREVLYLDLKPSNIVRDQDGRLWLVDFGCTAVAGVGPGIQVTRGFSAPEQFRAPGGALDVATEVYALGRTLLYLLLRSDLSYRAFVSFSAQTHSLRYFRPDLPAELEYILETMTAENKAERFSSLDAVQMALEQCLARGDAENSVLRWRSERKIRQYRVFACRFQTMDGEAGENPLQAVTEAVMAYELENTPPNWDKMPTAGIPPLESGKPSPSEGGT